MAATVFEVSQKYHFTFSFVISCAQKSLNCKVLNLKCTKELQNFANTKVLIVHKLDHLNTTIH